MYQEGVTAEFFRGGANVLQIALPEITKDELREYKKSKVRAGLLFENGVNILFFKFGGLPWMDCPFNAANIETDKLTVPTLESKTSRLLVEMHLIDADTGLVKALRAFTLSPKLSEFLINAARDQREQPRNDYDQQLNALYQYPTDVLIKRAYVSPCG